MQAAAPAHVDPAALNALSWRLIGPFRGGRALAVTGVPGHPERYYFGAVDGGVWESDNAGRTWNPIFDAEHVGSIGAIAVAPSNPNVIYVGSGEADMRSDIAYGNGMYKSTDGGKTWSHIGLDDTMQIGSIVVDPTNADIAYVAALGHAYGPNAMRGVFKTTDGGKTWTKVLYKNANTGAIDLSIDPQHPETIYAALWQTRRPPWNIYPPSNGPGSGLYKSTDGGKTWSQLTNGLPKHVGRIGVAVAPSQPSTVYAQVDTPTNVATGGLYRSDDAGATWTHVNGGKKQVRLWERGWYFGGVTVDPKNANVVYLMDTATYRSNDGGKTFVAIKGSPGGDDYHALWINPNDPSHMILGGDQGVVVSVDNAKTWSSWYNQPTGQFYHVATDGKFFYHVYGAQQDSGAEDVASQSIHQNITALNWRPIDVGGENGYVAPDPAHPGYVYGGSDTVTYEQIKTGWERSIDPQTAYTTSVWRHVWTLPLVYSRIDNAVYTARQEIFRSTDRGSSWKIISPDLTRGAGENRPSNLDPATLADSSGLPRRGVVYALAPSQRQRGLIWAGTDDGKIWITRNGGKHWSDVTPKALTAWSKVGVIEASHFDTNTAYAAIDRHRLNDYKPYIYATHDGGRTWSPIASGIPNGAFVNVVREDPTVRGLLYAGTELGMYVSFDDGAHWQSLQRNLPVTSIRDIDVHGNDLVVATHGRAFWIMDDVAPLRQLAQASITTNHLFAPPVTYRARRAGGVGGGIADEGTPIQPDDPQAPNPPLGMYIDYYLARAASTPVVIDILDASGHSVRRFSSADKIQAPDPSKADVAPRWLVTPPAVATGAGSHRFVWDFTTRHDGGPLAPPGRYTIRLTVDGKTYQQTATLRRDPRINVTDAQLREQYALASAIEDRLAQIAAARKRAQALLEGGKLSAAQAKHVRVDVLGESSGGNPDNSVGSPVVRFDTLRALDNAFSGLEYAVESADAPPTADQRTAYGKLQKMLNGTLARLNRTSAKGRP